MSNRRSPIVAAIRYFQGEVIDLEQMRKKKSEIEKFKKIYLEIYARSGFNKDVAYLNFCSHCRKNNRDFKKYDKSVLYEWIKVYENTVKNGGPDPYKEYREKRNENNSSIIITNNRGLDNGEHDDR